MTEKKPDKCGDVILDSVLRHRIQKLKNIANHLSYEIDELCRIDLIKNAYTQKRDFYEAVQQFQITLIAAALGSTGGHQRRAARLLGLGYTTLNAMIKRYNIQPIWHQHEDESESSARRSNEERYVSTTQTPQRAGGL